MTLTKLNGKIHAISISLSQRDTKNNIPNLVRAAFFFQKATRVSTCQLHVFFRKNWTQWKSKTNDSALYKKHRVEIHHHGIQGRRLTTPIRSWLSSWPLNWLPNRLPELVGSGKLVTTYFGSWVKSKGESLYPSKMAETFQVKDLIVMNCPDWFYFDYVGNGPNFPHFFSEHFDPKISWLVFV